MERDKLDTLQKLDRFLADVQGRAYRIAQIATNNPDDALDLVQDAMFKLVEKYSGRPESEWGPLFYSILQSRTNDWHRRNTVRRRIMGWLLPSENDGEDPIERVADESQRSPYRHSRGVSSRFSCLEFGKGLMSARQRRQWPARKAV